ncbi:MAG: hypothetical protein H6508_02200 [Calditrichaeota bacterium]|nr:hypothetical protein [Calditrichota bacterium]
MAKKNRSAIRELLISLRRVVVLLVAAFAIAMKWPVDVLLFRVIALWASLVILSHGAEILFQYLMQRAMEHEAESLTLEQQGAAKS